MPMTSIMLKKGGPGTSGKVPGFMKKKRILLGCSMFDIYEVSCLFLNFGYSIEVLCVAGVKQK